MSVFPSQRANNVKFWCFLYSCSEWIVEKLVDLTMMLNVLMPIKHHCNIVCTTNINKNHFDIPKEHLPWDFENLRTWKFCLFNVCITSKHLWHPRSAAKRPAEVTKNIWFYYIISWHYILPDVVLTLWHFIQLIVIWIFVKLLHCNLHLVIFQ